MLKRFKSLHSNESGAHFVELTFTVPIFFLYLFVMFDLARIAVFYTGAFNAARAGARYGSMADSPNRPEWATIQARFGWQLSIPPGQVGATLITEPVFHNGPIGTYDNEFYQQMTNAAMTFVGETRSPLATFYRTEAKAIAYSYGTLREIIGEFTYPLLDTSDEWNEPIDSGACFTIRGSDSHSNAFFNGSEVYAKMLGVRCDVQVKLWSSILTFGFGPEYFRLSSTAFEDVGHLPDWIFNVFL